MIFTYAQKILGNGHFGWKPKPPLDPNCKFPQLSLTPKTWQQWVCCVTFQWMKHMSGHPLHVGNGFQKAHITNHSTGVSPTGLCVISSCLTLCAFWKPILGWNRRPQMCCDCALNGFLFTQETNTHGSTDLLAWQEFCMIQCNHVGISDGIHQFWCATATIHLERAIFIWSRLVACQSFKNSMVSSYFFPNFHVFDSVAMPVKTSHLSMHHKMDILCLQHMHVRCSGTTYG